MSGYILVPANPGSPRKMAVEMERERDSYKSAVDSKALTVEQVAVCNFVFNHLLSQDSVLHCHRWSILWKFQEMFGGSTSLK